MSDQRHEKREDGNETSLYDRRKPPRKSFFGHLWDWARSGFTLTMLAGLIIFVIKVVNAHAQWMNKVLVIEALEPQITKDHQTLQTLSDVVGDIKEDTKYIRRHLR